MVRQISRGEFLKRMGGLSVIAFLDRSTPVLPLTDVLNHPEPRPGITAEKVLKVEDLGEKPRKAVVEAFEAARQYPQVFDGLACGCGCQGDASHQHRSLLVCYETKQPTGSAACQMEASFVGKLVREGKTLVEIRAAVDKKFG